MEQVAIRFFLMQMSIPWIALEWNGNTANSYLQSSFALSIEKAAFMIWLFSVVNAMRSSDADRDMHLIRLDMTPATSSWYSVLSFLSLY